MKRRWKSGRKTSEQGQTAAAFIIMLAALILLVGLVVDTGIYALTLRRAQIATDSAALAAAMKLDPNHFDANNQAKLLDEAQGEAKKYAHTNYPSMQIFCNINGTRVDCTGVRPVTFLIFPSTTVVVRASAEFQYGIKEAGDAGK